MNHMLYTHDYMIYYCHTIDRNHCPVALARLPSSLETLTFGEDPGHCPVWNGMGTMGLGISLRSDKMMGY